VVQLGGQTRDLLDQVRVLGEQREVLLHHLALAVKHLREAFLEGFLSRISPSWWV
jgi:hypothetical protein